MPIQLLLQRSVNCKNGNLKLSKFEFNTFSNEVRSRVEQQIVKPGDILFMENSPVERFYFCKEGCIRLEVFPQKNKAVVLYRARDGETIAEEHLVLDKYGYRAVADKLSIVESVPKTLILNDIRTNPAVAKNFIYCLAKRNIQLRINFERLGIKSAKERVLHFLKGLAMQSPGPLELSGKLKSLSGDMNLTHEAMYRALKELEQEGFISREGGSISLLESRSE